MKRLLILLLALIPLAAAGQMEVAAPRIEAVDFRPDVPSLPQTANLVSGETELPAGMGWPLRVIWSGSEYLVVGRGPGGLVATRLDGDGRVLDDPPLLIDTGPSEIRDIAFDGENYLVVYIGGSQGGYGSSLNARRIAAIDGGLHLVDRAPIPVSRADWPATGWIYDATVSFGGGYFLIAWSRQTEQGYDVATIRLTMGGEMVGEAVSLWSPLGSEETPRAAFDGRRFLVAWYSRGRIGATFIDPASGVSFHPLALFDPPDPSSLASAPRVVWNGSRYLVVWNAGEFPRDVRVEGVLLDPAGGETRFALPVTEEPRFITDASWDGSAFIVSWNEGFYNCTLSTCPLPEYRMGFACISGEGAPVIDVTDLGWGVLDAHASTPAGQTLFIHQQDERTWARLFNSEHSLFPGDLVAGFGIYPSFDGAESFGSIHIIRDGVLSERIDSYRKPSQGANDLVNGVSVGYDREIVFDRGFSFGMLKGGVLMASEVDRNISSWVQDRAGNIFFASGYGIPVLEKLTLSGEVESVGILPGVSGWKPALDLAADQCTLWYSSPETEGIFQLDICRGGTARAIASRAARGIRILPDGGALVAFSTGIARIDAEGRVLAGAPYRLVLDGDIPEFVSFSVDDDQRTVWIGEGSLDWQKNLVYKVSLDDLSSLLAAYQISSKYGALTALAVYPEWRASTSRDPRPRRRLTGRQ